MRIEEFDNTSNDSCPIVIYGATVGGKLIFQSLQKIGIDVAFFVDRDKEKKICCGIEVKDPSVLMRGKEYKVLIALTRSFSSACQYLKEIGYEKVYSCKNLIKDKTVEDYVYDENERVLFVDFLNKYPIYVANVSNHSVVLPALEVLITERCTLRCRDCSHLIPRYGKPIDYSIDEVINYLSNVLAVVDYISDLIILGGEPLLHKEISKLLEYCHLHEKIGNITIISNGTVMPNENTFDAMNKTKTRLRLSDYGKYSVRLVDIQKKCIEQDVICYVNNELWTDMGEIYDHNYSEEELKNIFTDCPFSYSLLLLKGKIFRCAHVAHLNNLGIINSYNHDSVDFSEICQKDIMTKKIELMEYMKISYLVGCTYCNGIKNSVQGIEPAIQGIR